MKNRFRLFTMLMVIALVFLPTGAVFAQGPGPEGGRVVFGQNLTIDSGDIFTGDLIVFGGNVTIEEDAKLDGNLVVFGGQVTSDGEVDGDLVMIGGQVRLDEHARVTGDVVTVGGQLDRAEGAVVEGEVVNNVQPEITIPNGSVPGVPEVDVPDVVRVSFNPFWEFARILGVSLLMAFLAMLATLFFQDRLGGVSKAVVSQPLMTSSIGLLTIVALIFVAVTIILLPVALLGLIPLGLAWLFGVVALGQEIGERFAKAVQKDWTPAITAGLGTFVLVLLLASVQALNDLLPFMVCVTWILPVLVGLMAIGSVVITRFGARPIQGAAMNVYVPPPDTGQPPPQSS
jgi:cytoskeletal protein CcmA (bactofilin family)